MGVAVGVGVGMGVDVGAGAVVGVGSGPGLGGMAAIVADTIASTVALVSGVWVGVAVGSNSATAVPTAASTSSLEGVASVAPEHPAIVSINASATTPIIFIGLAVHTLKALIPSPEAEPLALSPVEGHERGGCPAYCLSVMRPPTAP